MHSCQFTVELSHTELSPHGVESVEFLFSANAGMTAKPIGKVASGGELSRLMLSIKALLTTKSSLPSIIFDEIDTGISGEIAEKMGKIIREMSLGTQVLTITHLPQIAALGHQQMKVYKQDFDGQSQTLIKTLDHKERLEEIARLLSGERIGEEALNNAKVLLETAS
jgi:DNA repair protein RecN (Recombination protein N)